jgi:hypothetical protein
MNVQGLVDPRFKPAREAVAAVVGRLAGTGAAVAVWYDGAWVVDLWGGWADMATRRPGSGTASCNRIQSASHSPPCAPWC